MKNSVGSHAVTQRRRTIARNVRSEKDNYVPYLTVFSMAPFKRLKYRLSATLVTSGMYSLQAIANMKPQGDHTREEAIECM